MDCANRLSVNNITKTYPGVRALDDVSIEFRKAEVHALVGENGAGKSTLTKILTGAIEPDSGEIVLGNDVRKSFTPHHALEAQIAAIYQEFNLVPFLTVAENVFLGKEMRSGPFLQSRRMNAETSRLLATLGVELDPATLVMELPVAYQQIVEIVKALANDIRILIMDEPSAALTTREIKLLFRLVKTLKEKGVTIIYVSHKMSEVFELADRITVLRDGKFVSTLDADKTDRSELVRLMIGRELGQVYPPKQIPGEDVLLEVKKLRTPALPHEISFTLRKGEILGLAGLVGAGRTEIVRAIFGADPVESGEILVEGRRIHVTNPGGAAANGIGLVPEDRKRHGILSRMSVRENISFSTLRNLSRFSFINDKEEKKTTASFKEKLNIKVSSLETAVGNLSGGNQQKVVLAKWLATRCRILLLDEPTRGIDVGAKQEIYKIATRLASEGTGIIFISSELPELLGLADRILVIRAREITGSFQKGQATQETLLHLAMGK